MNDVCDDEMMEKDEERYRERQEARDDAFSGPLMMLPPLAHPVVERFIQPFARTGRSALHFLFTRS